MSPGSPGGWGGEQNALNLQQPLISIEWAGARSSVGIHGPGRGALGPPAGAFLVELTEVTTDDGAVAVDCVGRRWDGHEHKPACAWRAIGRRKQVHLLFY